jgi:hemoglobin-like flavoprotein
MAHADKLQLIEKSLFRAAEQIEDLTAPVMALLAARFPETVAAFDHHGQGKPEKLRAEMMDNLLYCLMTWFERPDEIRILLYGSIPHHHDTLNVHADWYWGLLDAGVEVIAATIPADEANELAAWAELREGLQLAAIEARDGLVC